MVPVTVENVKQVVSLATNKKTDINNKNDTMVHKFQSCLTIRATNCSHINQKAHLYFKMLDMHHSHNVIFIK